MVFGRCPLDESELEAPLKDCPFCGFKAEMFRLKSGYVIRCSNIACRAEQNAYPSITIATTRWNRRVTEIIEAIKDEE